MIKYLGLAILVVCLANVLTQQEEDKEEEQQEDEEEDEGWPVAGVFPGLLVHIHQPGRNCSLAMLDQRYPPVYPDGRASSQQLVVGCLPSPEGEDGLQHHLWQIQPSQTEVSQHIL